MKKIIVSILLLFCIFCHGQVTNDLIIAQIEMISEDNGEEYTDYSELIDAYWDLADNPVDINSEDVDQLANLRFINIFQLENIKKYRKDYGDFQSIDELKFVESLDDKTIEIIKPLICFQKNKKKDKINAKTLFKYGKHKLIFEVDQCLNEKKGYKTIADSSLYKKPNSTYLGSPQRLYFRYNYNYGDKIETGFAVEKDPGEYFFKNNINDSIKSLLGKNCYTGFDFFSFHLYLKDILFAKAIAIGDYKLSFGQGLTMGSGISFIAKEGTLLRKNKKITACKSANEINYLRGIATTLAYKKLELSIFYSIKKSDAHIGSYDTLTNKPLTISALQQTGLHRTYNEIIDRHIIKQQLYGGNLSFKTSNFQLGYTIHKTDLNVELSPEPRIYNLFYFQGKSIINQGIDFYYIFKNMAFYGEVAMSNNKGLAGLMGTTIQVAGYIEFTILYRNYAKNYQNFYSNAFAAGSHTRNEEGWYFTTSMSLAANWKLVTSMDFFKSDWFKNTAYAPSHGHDFNIQLNYQPDSKTLLFVQFRNKDKMKNTSNKDIYQRYLVHDHSNMVRFHLTYPINEMIVLKNRVEYHLHHTEEEEKTNAFLIYQDIIYNSKNEVFSIAFRYELFDAEKGSVYTYENDVLYAFAISSLSHKGMKAYLLGKINLFNKLQISGKIGFTIYDNIDEIGSGLETIEGNWRADGKIQIIWKI